MWFENTWYVQQYLALLHVTIRFANGENFALLWLYSELKSHITVHFVQIGKNKLRQWYYCIAGGRHTPHSHCGGSPDLDRYRQPLLSTSDQTCFAPPSDNLVRCGSLRPSPLEWQSTKTSFKSKHLNSDLDHGNPCFPQTRQLYLTSRNYN